jgi:hypothetical protein
MRVGKELTRGLARQDICRFTMMVCGVTITAGAIWIAARGLSGLIVQVCS